MTPAQIKNARLAAGLTQAQAAKLVHITPNSWARVERGEKPMDPARWELFLIKTEQNK